MHVKKCFSMTDEDVQWRPNYYLRCWGKIIQCQLTEFHSDADIYYSKGKTCCACKPVDNAVKI